MWTYPRAPWSPRWGLDWALESALTQLRSVSLLYDYTCAAAGHGTRPQANGTEPCEPSPTRAPPRGENRTDRG